MKIPLTTWQIQCLADYFERAERANEAGSPSMLVAQLEKHPTRKGTYTLEPCFLDHEKALPLVEAGRREIPGNTRERAQHVD